MMPFETDLAALALFLIVALPLIYVTLHLLIDWERGLYRAYIRRWCQVKIYNDGLALTEAGIETMVNYLWNKMKDRSDMWDCELYISPSVYRRIVNEYSRRKEW